MSKPPTSGIIRRKGPSSGSVHVHKETHHPIRITDTITQEKIIRMKISEAVQTEQPVKQ